MYVQELYFESPFRLEYRIVIVVDVQHLNLAIEFPFTGIIK